MQRNVFAFFVLFLLSYFTVNAQGPPGYVKVADENGSHHFDNPADVAYGANGSFLYKNGVTGDVHFSNDYFGGDPVPGVAKAGYYKQGRGFNNGIRPNAPRAVEQPAQQAAPPAPNNEGPRGFAKVADENGSHDFGETVDVAYGANGSFAYKRGVTGNVQFSNDYFGTDPAPGVGKSGYYRVVRSNAPRVVTEQPAQQSAPQPQPSNEGPRGFTKVADENGSHDFGETVDVAYGANGSFAYKRGVTGNVQFSNDYFGTDPAPGVGKSGYYRVARVAPPKLVEQPAQSAPQQQQPSNEGPRGFTKVADENGSHDFGETVDVAYGANGQFVYKRGVTGNVQFSNDYFGSDPAPGVGKSGYYRAVRANAPRVTEQPAQQSAPQSQPTNEGPRGFAKVADENGSHDFGETVDIAYGANGQFVYKRGVTGNVQFSNDYFGSDPAPGVGKSGYYRVARANAPRVVEQPAQQAAPQQQPSNEGPSGFTKVADENGSHAFGETVDVAYGANGQFVYKRGITGQVDFSNDYFGNDPAPGVEKSGYYKVARSAAPRVVEQPAQQAAPQQQPSYEGPPGFRKAGDENVSHNFSETVDVAYGANGQFVFKRGVTGQINFSNDYFGSDPAPGVAKSGYYRVARANAPGVVGQPAQQQPQQSNDGPSGYNKVADENGSHIFDQAVDIAYGANGSFAYKRGVTGNVQFSNDYFGTDPAPGVAKSGYYKTSAGSAPAQVPAPAGGSTGEGPHGYTKVADENGSHNFNQVVDVAYGANGQFVYKKAVTGNIRFSNDYFRDPAPGIAKSGYYKTVAGSSPAQGSSQTAGSSNSDAPPGYKKIAEEGGSHYFSIPAELAYGANGHFIYTPKKQGNITFTNEYFGGDPAPGTAKSGYYKATPETGAVGGFAPGSASGPPASASELPAGFTKIRDEGGEHTFENIVDIAYGADGKYLFKYKVTGPVKFDNDFFGNDPAPGLAKVGYYRMVSAAPATAGNTPDVSSGEAAGEASSPGSLTEANGASANAGPPAGYQKTAEENGSFTFREPVDLAYGGAGKYYYKKGVTGTIRFDNGTFGGDPAPGEAKAGYMKFSNSGAVATGNGIPDAPDDGSVYVDVPDMPQSDLLAIMNWIKNKTTAEKLPYCWKQSYIESPHELSACPSGKSKHLALCYPNCRAGYEERLDRCFQSGCPAGFRDDGLTTCWKPADYGNGAGRIPDVRCPDGFHQMGIGAASWCSTYHFGDLSSKTTSSIKGCNSDEELADGFCYKKCRPGYHKTTNNFCSAECPPGMSNSGAGCLKDSYYNTAGTPLTCPPGLEQNGALCYKSCKGGYHNIAGVCWQSCGAGWSECGAGCSKTSMDCGMTITDQVVSVLSLVANIASLGMAEPATVAAHAGEETVQVGAKVMTGTTKVGKSTVSLISKLKNSNAVKKVIQIKERVYNERTKKIVEVLSKMKEVYDVVDGTHTMAQDFYNDFADDFIAQTSEEINSEIDNRFGPKTARFIKQYWGSIQLAQMSGADAFQISQDALSLISIGDPTGVVGVVSAYTKPKCLDMIAFPVLSQQYK